MPDGDRAAVDVEFAGVGARLLEPGQRDGGEGFVDLVEVDVLELEPGLLEHARGARDGTFEHQDGVAADHRLGRNPGSGLEPQLGRLLLRHQEHSGGAVGDLRGVAGGDRVLGVEGRLEGGHRLVGGVAADALVPCHDLGRVAVGGDLDGHDLGLQVALVAGRGRVQVALHAELVHGLALDAVLAGDQLGGDALRHHVVELGQLGREGVARPLHDRGAHRHPRHRLHASRDGDVADAGLDQVGREVDGLLTGAALAVDGGGGCLDREARRQPGVAGDVDGLLAGLHHVPEDDVFDQPGLDAGAVDQLLQHHGSQDDRVEVFELAVALAHGGTNGFDDDHFAHAQTLLSQAAESGLAAN